MAKLSAHGTELFRYFSTKERGLISVRSDGYALVRYPGSNWQLRFKRKAGSSLDDWETFWKGVYERLASWKKRVDHLPTLEQLQAWSLDSVCETTDGLDLEPDYRGDREHGPSWLVALGYV